PDPPAAAGGVPVVRVVDGDTIRVRRGGREEPVRLIGIDTPEMGFFGGVRECFAREASRFATGHLLGRRVRLELDVERRDRYDRLLAYVWLDGRLFNEMILRQGYASVATYPPNVRYVERFLRAERQARAEGRGLWSACT
ncbi:MAG TPA: thermonuclease family protein, partial [Actinomycetota bacterium]|nr:thermonuclease family protein [Actinomycetota bacterium]